jgi:excisionase family DNA binding protein
MANDDLASDMLDGLSSIAKYLGIPVRRAYDLAERGKLPLFKFEGGRNWQGRKSTLRRHIEQREAGGK